jgi:drug/metabolite transporter (DMT)-like permease|tara:strand:+ start:3511 stop:4368 length:858 start_codon:yes stop_codon:yes gene_type:complete
MLNSLYAPNVGIFFAFLSSIFWGFGGFFAGQASRRGSLLPTLTLDIFIGLFLVVPLAFSIADTFTWRDFLIGGLAGLFGMSGAAFLYAGMKKAAYVTVIPVSGVAGALFPVLWGLVDGDSLSILQIAGILVGLISIALASGVSLQTFKGPIAGLRDGILAGLGFGGFYIVIENTSNDTEPWGAVASRLFPLLILIFILFLIKDKPKPSKEAFPFIVGSGLSNACASTCFLLAVNRGLLSVTSLLSALYPAITVVLAHFLIKEKMTRTQVFGVLAAIFSMASITIS